MTPLYTLLRCLPAALVLIACGCGLAALWSPMARPTAPSLVGRPRDRRRTAGGSTDASMARGSGAPLVGGAPSETQAWRRTV
jgi:hypothetical protein